MIKLLLYVSVNIINGGDRLRRSDDYLRSSGPYKNKVHNFLLPSKLDNSLFYHSCCILFVINYIVLFTETKHLVLEVCTY